MAVERLLGRDGEPVKLTCEGLRSPAAARRIHRLPEKPRSVGRGREVQRVSRRHSHPGTSASD